MFWNGWRAEGLYLASRLAKAWFASSQARGRFSCSHGTQRLLVCTWLLMQGAKHEHSISKRRILAFVGAPEFPVAEVLYHPFKSLLSEDISIIDVNDFMRFFSLYGFLSTPRSAASRKKILDSDT